MISYDTPVSGTIGARNGYPFRVPILFHANLDIDWAHLSGS